MGAAARSTSQRCGRRSGNIFANMGERAQCPASIQAAAKDVHEKWEKKSAKNMLLALRANGGSLRPTSGFFSYISAGGCNYSHPTLKSLYGRVF